MLDKMSPTTEQEYKIKIEELQKEIEVLKKKQTEKIKAERYGLNWIDVPEAFEKESENKIPVLEEVKDKAIKNDDGKPTHILIEGDNYHALKCLNYTHAGKIDVIYIDPPYNTGSDGFIYKDVRFLEQFPDGTTIPKEHPLRHSTWLSFMNKRLKLAKNLLSEKGVIFISIDDNEQANLKLLCDQIFGEENFVGNITWESTTQPINAGTAKFQLQQKVEYIFCYAKNIAQKRIFKLHLENVGLQYPHNGKFGKCRFEIIEKSDAGSYQRDTMKFQILGQNPRKGKRWQIGEDTARYLEKVGKVEIVDGIVKKAVYPEDEIDKQKYTPFWSHFSAKEYGTAQTGKDELNEILGFASGFDTVKSSKLIKELIFHSTDEHSIILDFFAGSGTTLQSVMQQNEEDFNFRKCIICTNNENQICSKITFPRIENVMNGYTNAKGEEIPGLGNSLKYYKTDFIGEHSEKLASDEDKILLAQKAGCLISLSENTLEEIKTTEYYQLYTDGKKLTAIYFNEDPEMFPDFVEDIAEVSVNSTATHKTTVYVYCEGNPEIYENEFDDLTDIEIKAIPQPILQIYKTLNETH